MKYYHGSLSTDDKILLRYGSWYHWVLWLLQGQKDCWWANFGLSYIVNLGVESSSVYNCSHRNEIPKTTRRYDDDRWRVNEKLFSFFFVSAHSLIFEGDYSWHFSRSNTCCSDCCCSIDIWGIALNIILQDAPFLTFRLLIIIHYQIISYMNVFFTCKACKA